MAKMDPSKYSKTYEKQETLLGFAKPPTGIYHAVNISAQRQKVGKNATPKIVFKTYLLKAVEAPASAGEFIGKTTNLDFWADFTKDMNSARMDVFGYACSGGNNDEWDPEDDASLIKTCTGRPYLLNLINKVEKYEGKDQEQLEIKEVKFLSASELEPYAKNPDFKKIVGPAAQRMLEAKDFSKKDQGDGKKGSSHDDGGSKGGGLRTDDIPF